MATGEGQGSRNEDGRMEIEGRAAPIVDMEQSQSPMRPIASGGQFFPGQGTNVFTEPNYPAPCIAARTIRVHLPQPPAPRRTSPLLHGTPLSANVEEATIFQGYTRFQFPSTFEEKPRSPRVISNFGLDAPLLPNNLKDVRVALKGIQIEEIGTDEDENAEKSTERAAAPRAPGVRTRAQIRRETGSQNEMTSNISTHSVNAWCSNKPPEDEVTPETTRKVIESESSAETTRAPPMKTTRAPPMDGHSDSDQTSESNLRVPPPWRSELETYLEQIQYNLADAEHDDEDTENIILAMEGRLGRAKDIVTALLKRVYTWKSKSKDLQEENRQIKKNWTKEESILKSENTNWENRCRKLTDNLAQAEHNYTRLDSLRTQLSTQQQKLEEKLQSLRMERDQLQENLHQMEASQVQYMQRLKVYSKQAADLNYPFDNKQPPLGRPILDMIYRHRKVQAGAMPQPTHPVATAQQIGQPFAGMPPPFIPVGQPMPVPSALASTQPATSSTQLLMPPGGPWTGNTPKLPKPRTFSVHRGGSCYMDFRKWTDELRSYLVLTKVDPSLWAECAVYYLDGFARQLMWKELTDFQNSQHARMDFDHFCRCMQTKILPPRNPALVGLQLEKILYRSGSETLAAFKGRILENLQAQKGDVPLSEVDYETAKVLFLNKLPDAYKVFIYRQNWVMDNPTLDNYQKAAELYEASNELADMDTYDQPWIRRESKNGVGTNKPFRDRSRPRTWKPSAKFGNRGGASGFSERKPGGESPYPVDFCSTDKDIPRSSSNSPGNRQPSSVATKSDAGRKRFSVQCCGCGEYRHLLKDCTNARMTSAQTGRTTTARGRGRSTGNRARVHNIQLVDVDTASVELRSEASTDSDTDQVVMFIGEDSASIPSCCRGQICYMCQGVPWLDDPQPNVVAIEGFSVDLLTTTRGAPDSTMEHDRSIMFEQEEEEEESSLNNAKFWELQVDAVGLEPNEIARNICRAFDPTNKDLDKEILGLEPLGLGVSMAYSDLDIIIRELQKEPNFDKEATDQYFSALIDKAGLLSELDEETSERMRQQIVTYIYRRMARYYLGSRSFLRSYFQSNPDSLMVHAEDWLYRVSVNDRIAAIPISPEQDADIDYSQEKEPQVAMDEGTSNVQAGRPTVQEPEGNGDSEIYEVVKELDMEHDAAVFQEEKNRQYEPLIPRGIVPIATPRNEIAGIHYPAIIDIVTVKHRKIAGKVVKSGTEELMVPPDYLKTMMQKVAYKQFDQTWKILIPEPVYESTKLALWEFETFYIVERDENGDITLTTEKFPGASILLELVVTGWNITRLLEFAASPAYPALSNDDIDSFLRHLDFILFLSRLTIGRKAICADYLQDEEFLYFPQFPTVQDFQLLQTWMKVLPEMEYELYAPEAFAGINATTYSRLVHNVTDFIRRKLHNKNTWNLVMAQMPIGRRRKDFALKGMDEKPKPNWQRNFGVKDVLAYVAEDTRYGERVPYIQERQCGAFWQKREYSDFPEVNEYVLGRPERLLHTEERLPASRTTTGGPRQNIAQAFLSPDLTQLSWEEAQYPLDDAHAEAMTLQFAAIRRNQDHCDGKRLLDETSIETCKGVGEMIRHAVSSPMATYCVSPRLLNPAQRARYLAFANEWQPRVETAATAAFQKWKESGWKQSHLPHFWPGITEQLTLSIRNHCYIANDPDGEILLEAGCPVAASTALDHLSKLINQLQLAAVRESDETTMEQEIGREDEERTRSFWDIITKSPDELPHRQHTTEQLLNVEGRYVSPILEAPTLVNEEDSTLREMTFDFGLAERLQNECATRADAHLLAEFKLLKYRDLLLTEPEYLRDQILGRILDDVPNAPGQIDQLITGMRHQHFDIRAWYLAYNRKISVATQVLLYGEVLFDYGVAEGGYQNICLVGPATDPTKPNLTTPAGDQFWLIVRNEETYEEKKPTVEQLRSMYRVPRALMDGSAQIVEMIESDGHSSRSTAGEDAFS